MATLSFTCPKCGKLHSRIKPEMAGHKVRCLCSFVFRLGPKTDKQPGVAEDIKRRRAVKNRKIATHKNAFQLKKPHRAEELLAPVEIDQPTMKKPAVEELLEPVEIDQPDELLNAIDLGNEKEQLQPIKVENTRPSKSSSGKKSIPRRLENAGASISEAGSNQDLLEAKPLIEDLDEDDLLPDDEPLIDELDEDDLLPDDEPIFSDPLVPEKHWLDDDSDEHIHTAELDSDESILDAIPISTEPYQPSAANQPRFKQDIPVSPFLDQPIVAQAVPAFDPLANNTATSAPNIGSPFAGPGQPLPVASPMTLPVATPIRKPQRTSYRKRKKGEVELKSLAGPIASLVVAIIGLPIMMVLTFFATGIFMTLMTFYSHLSSVAATPSVHGNSVVVFIFSAFFCLSYIGLTICITISGVTAVMEMAKNTYIRWGHKLAAIVASVVLLLLFVSYVYHIGNFIYAMQSLKTAGKSMGGGLVSANVSMGGFIISTTLVSMGHALVPLAVAICGFIRGRK